MDQTPVPMVALVYLLITLGFVTQADDPDISERIDRIAQGLLGPVSPENQKAETWSIQQRMEHYQVPGVSIAFIDGDTLSWTATYGQTRAGNGEAITPETVFQAASISKPLTAAAALQLVEENKLQLNSDINQKLESWKIETSSYNDAVLVSLESILSHSAGLTVHGFRGYKRESRHPDVHDILEGSWPANSSPVIMESMPGTGTRYSGGGYTVLQLLIEEITGDSFQHYLDRILQQQLDMQHSTFDQPVSDTLSGVTMARGHAQNGAMVEGGWHVYPEKAAAGLWTTPSDLARFLVEIQEAYHGQSDFLSQDMAGKMLEPIIDQFGLGFQLWDTDDDNARFGHGGSNHGFRAQAVAFKEKGQGVVIMTNSDNGGALISEILRSISVEYDWEAYQPETRQSLDIERELLQSYTGSYELPNGVKLHIGLQNEQLHLHLGERPPLPLHAQSRNRFYTLDSNIDLQFVNDQNSEETLLIINSMIARSVE